MNIKNVLLEVLKLLGKVVAGIIGVFVIVLILNLIVWLIGSGITNLFNIHLEGLTEQKNADFFGSVFILSSFIIAFIVNNIVKIIKREKEKDKE